MAHPFLTACPCHKLSLTEHHATTYLVVVQARKQRLISQKKYSPASFAAIITMLMPPGEVLFASEDSIQRSIEGFRIMSEAVWRQHRMLLQRDANALEKMLETEEAGRIRCFLGVMERVRECQICLGGKLLEPVFESSYRGEMDLAESEDESLDFTGVIEADRRRVRFAEPLEKVNRSMSVADGELEADKAEEEKEAEEEEEAEEERADGAVELAGENSV